MSSPLPPPSPDIDPKYEPALPPEMIEWRISLLPFGRRGALTNLVDEVGHGDFWTKPRFVQVHRMLRVRKAHRVTQKEIGFVLAVSNGLVTRLKQYFEQHPEEVRPAAGRPSELRDVFPRLKAFIEAETREGRSVTKSVLMAYATEIMTKPVSMQALAKYMERHKFAYVNAVPIEVERLSLESRQSRGVLHPRPTRCFEEHTPFSRVQ